MIEDLKRALGAGSRTNQYMLELSYGELDSQKFNILCKAASLPEAKISTVTAAYHGRKVVLRGETEFPETYEVTIYDDASMSMRKFFGQWMLAIDDPGKYKTKLTDDITGSKGFIGEIIDNVNDFVDQVENEINDLKDLPNRVQETVSSWWAGYTGLGGGLNNSMEFATSINVWLLNHQGEKIHGVTLEDAYPIGMGQIDLGADKQDEVVEYPVTFAFSDFFIIK